MEDRCVMCGDVVPEGRTVCPNCEHTIFKMGVILQSKNALKEDIKILYQQNKIIKETKE